MLTNLYTHRHYLFGSFWADFRYRYAGTALGFFWVILNPLLEVIVFSVVFSQLVVLRSGGVKGVPYVLFLITGLFPWFAFAQTIISGSRSLDSQVVYLRRLAIPPDVFVAKDALFSLFTLLIYLGLLIVASPIMGGMLSWALLYLPVLALLLGMLGYGLSLITAHLRVLFPDLGEVLNVLVQLWRWTLPIMYSNEGFPETIKTLMRYNPPYYFITSFRGVIINQDSPALEAWLHMGLWVIVFLMIGAFVARKLRFEVKDLLS